MANLWIRRTMYRLEQTGNNTFTLQAVILKDVQALDIKEIVPVNVLGGADVPTFGYLYSKVTMKQPGLNQELYALQTVLQWQTDLNS